MYAGGTQVSQEAFFVPNLRKLNGLGYIATIDGNVGRAVEVVITDNLSGLALYVGRYARLTGRRSDLLYLKSQLENARPDSVNYADEHACHHRSVRARKDHVVAHDPLYGA